MSPSLWSSTSSGLRPTLGPGHDPSRTCIAAVNSRIALRVLLLGATVVRAQEVTHDCKMWSVKAQHTNIRIRSKLNVFFNGYIKDKKNPGPATGDWAYPQGRRHLARHCAAQGTPHPDTRRASSQGTTTRLPTQNTRIAKTSVYAKVGYALHLVYTRAQDGPVIPLRYASQGRAMPSSRSLAHLALVTPLPTQNTRIDKTSVCAKVGYALHLVYAGAQDGLDLIPLRHSLVAHHSE
ncbi:hypothetical protein DFH07DRAFT_973112 [Mycena maculata]|uniref:Uncharacterized protein n=1 Tax=Mycena maculata TaxID=230809 RepID=A0AAD7HF35_9AGAR|nr:hypothetical protein DFH07DRAFT_973112 [Mycena maculata]